MSQSGRTVGCLVKYKLVLSIILARFVGGTLPFSRAGRAFELPFPKGCKNVQNDATPATELLSGWVLLARLYGRLLPENSVGMARSG